MNKIALLIALGIGFFAGELFERHIYAPYSQQKHYDYEPLRAPKK